MAYNLSLSFDLDLNNYSSAMQPLSRTWDKLDAYGGNYAGSGIDESYNYRKDILYVYFESKGGLVNSVA